MMEYTQEQIAIAKRYEALAMANIHNDKEFDRVMAEFEVIKKQWRAQAEKVEG